MIGYTHEYKSFEELIMLANDTFMGSVFVKISLTGSISAAIVVTCFFILPLIFIKLQERKNKKEKKEKKKLLTQILLQKELENEVEEEIKMQEQQVREA